MEESGNNSIQVSGSLIAKNTIYNLSGNLIPLIFALFLIPPVIKGLGTERFGILSIAWMIIGYFSFFDFGIGRGLTKIISERVGTKHTEQIPPIFWTSLTIMASISLLAAIVLSIFVPNFVNVFKISKNLQEETKTIFYLLALSIPIVTTTTGLRGLLEAYQKFAIINVMKVFLGMFTFLGPVLVLIITNSLFWIIAFLIATRIIIWILYLYQCLKTSEELRKEIKINFITIKPLLKFSMWITLGNIIVPIIFYSDRFLIGAIISASAITYYVTPFEVVIRLMVIPIALSTVLFPVFSATFTNNPDATLKLFRRGVKFIVIVMYPVIFIIVAFANEGITLWLGSEFASKSSLILQLLAIGIFMNSVSLIPTNFFEGIGKPRITALIVLVELPFYLLSMWLAITYSGINGAAFVFMVAATLNVSALYLIAYKLYSIKVKFDIKEFIMIFLIIALVFPFIVNSLYLKLIFALCFSVIFPLVAWKYFLSSEEKLFLFQKLKFR